jgi:hypothetical protein
MSPRRSPSARSPARPAKRAARAETPPAPLGWTFLSNHAHVLLCLSLGDDPRLRDVAERVGITERAVQKIVLDLEREGILTRRRDGRRNSYELDLDRPLRHPLESHRSIRDLVDLVRG